MTDDKKSISTCGCCEKPEGPGPHLIENRPGLSALAYRVGVHGQFKAAMKQALSDNPELEGLTVRGDDDFSISLLDAWAVTADVLTFYQERIANEGYLGTALERLSLLHLARLIGYQLNPGAAADTYLAFTIEDKPEPPPPVTIDSGTRVQSVPGPGEEAQTFETVEEIEARAEWNAITPRLTQVQQIHTGMDSIMLEGINLNLEQGDVIMILDDSANTTVKRILEVTEDKDEETTRIDFVSDSPDLSPAAFDDNPSGTANGKITDFPENTDLDGEVVEDIIAKIWKEDDLAALVKYQDWSTKELVDNIKEQLSLLISEGGKVFVFRQQAFPFGYNALKMPKYKTDGTGTPELPSQWPDWDLKEAAGKVYLDNAYEKIMPESYLLIQKPGTSIGSAEVYQVGSGDALSRTEYGISAKTTYLSLSPASQWWDSAVSGSDTLAQIRGITFYARSEELTPAQVPIEELAAGDTITLDSIYPGLAADQEVILTGERSDLEGVYASESKTLKEVVVEGGFTIITFEKDLTYKYLRDTVFINANVARATHGETGTEILGSGDAAQVFQQFTLSQTPLTYISASTPDGTESTLEVRVNDLLWTEVSSFYGHGPDERIYITRLGNDGKTYVMFGDGITGSRVPTGRENVTATYRKGIGVRGMVQAGQLTTLMTRPFGVKEVTNPNDASGAADAETVDKARENTPLTVLTLDRVVSLRDFEDFARAFAGIEKARADWVWAGQTRLVYITAAGAEGTAVEEDSTTYKNLEKAIKDYSNGRQPFGIGSYTSLSFYIKANITVDSQYEEETVKEEVKTTLEESYSFEERRLGQTVTKSEVLAMIQAVEGVEAVDLDELYMAGETAVLNDYLAAGKGRWDPGQNQPVPAQLLTLAPNGAAIYLMETES